MQAVSRFYTNILEAIKNHINFDVIKVVVLASPAFLKVRSAATTL
jgi:hypothetical protein